MIKCQHPETEVCVNNVILWQSQKTHTQRYPKILQEKKRNFKNIQVTHRKAGKRKQRRKKETNRKIRNTMSDISIITLNVNDF